MKFQRSVNLWSLLLIAVGGMVGSGWLFGPFYAAKIAGPGAVIAWALGGVLMIVVALTFAELATMFPIVGGTIRFLQFSHGPFVSFTFAWVGWISSAAVAPIETLALLQYASTYLPWLMHPVKGAYVLTSSGFIVAAFFLLLLCYINAIGVQVLAKTNFVIVTLKLLIPVVTIIVLLTYDFHGANFTSHGFLPYGWHAVLVALPTAGIIFSFIGYSPAIQLAGEAKNPQKAIPFAILFALFISMALYFFLQFAFIGAVEAPAIQKGWHALSFIGESGPFVGIATVLGMAVLVKVLYADAVISPMGTALLYTGSSARMCYAMCENGYMPKSLQAMNKYGVPSRIIGLNFILGLLLFLPFPAWQSMMSFLVSSLVLAYAVGPLALIVLRRSMPEKARPFCLPCPLLICLLAFYICNLIVFWTGWDTVSRMLMMIVVGYGFLFAYKIISRSKLLSFQMKHAWWVLVYLVLMGGTSYVGDFGGRNIVPFGWDFLMIGLVTVFIFLLAYTSGIYVEEGEE
jgi:amino acid transporter